MNSGKKKCQKNEIPYGPYQRCSGARDASELTLPTLSSPCGSHAYIPNGRKLIVLICGGTNGITIATSPLTRSHTNESRPRTCWSTPTPSSAKRLLRWAASTRRCQTSRPQQSCELQRLCRWPTLSKPPARSRPGSSLLPSSQRCSLNMEHGWCPVAGACGLGRVRRGLLLPSSTEAGSLT